MIPSPTDQPPSEVLDPGQLKRIESTHRGFLYQHLFAVACLLRAARCGVVAVQVERDEDIELVLPEQLLYVQVKTRSRELSRADIKDALERFSEVRSAHQDGSRALKAAFWIVCNTDPSAALLQGVAHEDWPADVYLLTPGYKACVNPSVLPPAWPNLDEATKWCVAAANEVPFKAIAPETLVWKLAAVVQFACTGSAPAESHRFQVDALPRLFEQIVVQLHSLPTVPVPYRAQQNELEFESSAGVRLITGFSGAGKTSWASEGSVHAGQKIGYFEVGDTPGSALVPCLARELAAQLVAADPEEFRKVFLPGATGFESLRAINAAIESNSSRPLIILDNAHRVEPDDLRGIVTSLSAAKWLLLAQPWPERTSIEAVFGIQAETMSGWSLETVGEVFQRRGCDVSLPDLERMRRLTGGLPLYVLDAARLTGGFYENNAQRLLDDLEALTNMRTTGQQAILQQVHRKLSARASDAAALLSIVDLPLSQSEIAEFLSKPLSLSASEVAVLIRELYGWGVVEAFRDGRMAIHDSFRVIAKERQLSLPDGIIRAARLALAAVLKLSLHDINRFRTYCNLLPLIGETKALVDITSGLSELFHEHGLSEEFIRILKSAADSDDLSAHDRFWAADTVAFWSLQERNEIECSMRLDQLEALLAHIDDNHTEKLAVLIKRMLLASKKRDLAAVRQFHDEVIALGDSTPEFSRIFRYDYAHALFKCHQFKEAETETFQLIMEYYDLLGLELEDVLMKNAPDVIAKVPDWENRIDDLKHLADSLDLHANVLNAQGTSSGFCRIHAVKFYGIADSVNSLIRVGQDFVDECLRRPDGAPVARDFIEQTLLPHVRHRKLLGHLGPVHSQYAVVLAYCGEIERARKVLASIESYANTMPKWKPEFENQRNLIEAIAAGKVRLRVPRPPSNQKQIKGHKVGRNDPCPCGSGIKYKKCCRP